MKGCESVRWPADEVIAGQVTSKVGSNLGSEHVIDL
jgi:hypothetical protein